jgi:hypothetical protein
MPKRTGVNTQKSKFRTHPTGENHQEGRWQQAESASQQKVANTNRAP